MLVGMQGPFALLRAVPGVIDIVGSHLIIM